MGTREPVRLQEAIADSMFDLGALVRRHGCEVTYEPISDGRTRYYVKIVTDYEDLEIVLTGILDDGMPVSASAYASRHGQRVWLHGGEASGAMKVARDALVA